MNIDVITSGYLPVPATKGGAVESIVENILKKNEKNTKVKMTIFSIEEKKAVEEGKKYNNCEFEFIKVPNMIDKLDQLICWIAKKILKKDNVMSYRYILQRIYYLNKVSKKLKENNTYNKVLIENHPTLFLALKWRKNYLKYENRYYYHVHNELKSSFGCEKVIKKCKKILCVSEYIKQSVVKFTGIEENKVDVLKNCINTDLFDGNIGENEKNRLKEKYNIKQNDKVMLYTGRLTKEKGIYELLCALEKVKYNRYKLLIVGGFFFNTELKNNFEIRIRDLSEKLKDKVTFTGFIEYNLLHNIYALSDIAILPSIWNDPAPLTVIESMASGLPIITTDSGGIPEYAKNGCAIIIKRDNKLIENLSKNIDLILNNNELRKKMSKISKENAKELNLDNYYKDFLKKMELDVTREENK